MRVFFISTKLPILDFAFSTAPGRRRAKGPTSQPSPITAPSMMAERADGHIVGHGNAGAEKDIGLDGDIAPSFVSHENQTELRRNQARAIGHGFLAAAPAAIRFHRGELGPAVDAGHFIGIFGR
jgi:hypothetical protein